VVTVTERPGNGWYNMKAKNKERVLQLIREGKNYSETNKELQEKESDSIAGSTYYRLKESVFPKEKMDKALEGAREKRVEREQKEHKDKRKVLWNSKKQKEADESNLAKLINKGVYHGVFPFCKSGQLKEENVQDVNLGGAVVANILYFFPDVNLDNPLIVLATRGILFYLKFKQICSSIREKAEDIKAAVMGGSSGIKPGWSEGK